MIKKRNNIFKGILIVSLFWCNIVFGQNTTLTVENASGPPGSVNNILSISLENQETVTGLMFKLNYDPAILIPANVSTANRTQDQSGLGFSMPADGELLITLFDFDGNNISPSSGDILQISFQISATAAPGQTPITLTETALSSTTYQAISTTVQNGSFEVTATQVLQPPLNLTAENVSGNVKLNWESPGSITNGTELSFDDGTFENSLGFNDGQGELVNGPFVPPAYPATLTAARFITDGSQLGDLVFLTVYVDSSGTATRPEETDYDDFTDDITIESDSVFQTVDMSDLEIKLPQGSSFFVGVFQIEDDNMSLGLDEDAPDGNAFFGDGFVFSPLTAANFHGVLGIRAIVDVSNSGNASPKIVELKPRAVDFKQKPTVSVRHKPSVSSEHSSFQKILNKTQSGPLSFNIYRSTSPNAARTGTLIANVDGSTTTFEDLSPPVATQYYQVTAKYDVGESLPSNEVSVVITSVGPVTTQTIPETFALLQNYPNPFNPTTEISYNIPSGFQETVTLTIYDLSGKKIRTLVNQKQGVGSYQVLWNGTNDLGQPMASGVFMYKLQAGSFSQSRKMLLLK